MLFKDYTRGGQTAMHAIRMFGQVSKRIILLSFLAYTIVATIVTYHKTSKYQWYLLVHYLEACFKITVLGDRGVIELKEPSGQLISMGANQFVKHKFLIQELNNFSSTLNKIFFISLKIIAVVLILAIIWLRYRGKAQSANQDLRGALFLEPKALTKFLKKHKKCSDLRIAKVPLVKDSETKHILITGTTGSGKSICMMEIMDQIRNRGQRAIVYDDSGTFIRHYYREGQDVILNPLDARSPSWNIWQEAENLADFEAIAASLMPLHLSGGDPFWIHSARTIFATLAEKLSGHDLYLLSKVPNDQSLPSCQTPAIVHDFNNMQQLIIKVSNEIKILDLAELKKISDFNKYEPLFNNLIKLNRGKERILLKLTDPIIDWIKSKAGHTNFKEYGDSKTKSLLRPMFSSDLNSLSSLLHGTVAEPLVAESVEKMALSIKSTLATYCKSLLYLTEENETLFSIKRWIQDEQQDSWIFISSSADKLEALKPLISVWIDLAARQMLSLSPSFDRRIWLLIDELASLHRLSSLNLLLSQGRKYGVCNVTAFQDIHQLKSIYGRDESEALLAMYNTNICYRTKCPDTAHWMSKLIGQREIIEKREGFSYGANDIRDGVSIQIDRRKEPLVLDAQFLKLNDREAYMLLPENTPVTKIKLAAKTRSIKAESLHPRKNLNLSLAPKDPKVIEIKPEVHDDPAVIEEKEAHIKYVRLSNVEHREIEF